MSDAPSTKLIDGATEEGDAKGVLGMHAVDDQIKPRASISVPIEKEITLVSAGDSGSNEKFERKLLTLKRQILIHMKRVCDNLSKCASQERFLELSQQFADIKISYDDYKIKLKNISNSEGIFNMSDSIINQFQKCVNSYESAKQRCYGQFSEESSVAIEGDHGVDLEPSDSVSQVTECYSIALSKAMARQIELDRKRAELRPIMTLLKQRRTPKRRLPKPKLKLIVASRRLGLMLKND